MLKKKSSVRISVEGHSDKKLEIPTFFVKHWQKVLAVTITLIFTLVGSLIYFTSQQKAESISSQYEASLDKVLEEKRLLSLSQDQTEKTVEEAKKSFVKIDSTLEIINNKMKKRGLKTISLANAGGPVENDITNIDLITDHYEEVLKELDKKLSSLPFGVPHPGDISSRFGYRNNPFTNRGIEMHSGIDIKGQTGDRIKSTASGTVVFADYEGDYGFVVKIKHSNGFETRYAHLSGILVRKGQKVEAGSEVGMLGSTGRSTGPHLHYEILKDNKKINPEKYFSL